MNRVGQRDRFLPPDDSVFVSRIGWRLDTSAIRRRYEAGLRDVSLDGLRHAAIRSSLGAPASSSRGTCLTDERFEGYEPSHPIRDTVQDTRAAIERGPDLPDLGR